MSKKFIKIEINGYELEAFVSYSFCDNPGIKNQSSNSEQYRINSIFVVIENLNRLTGRSFHDISFMIPLIEDDIIDQILDV